MWYINAYVLQKIMNNLHKKKFWKRVISEATVYITVTDFLETFIRFN